MICNRLLIVIVWFAAALSAIAESPAPATQPTTQSAGAPAEMVWIPAGAFSMGSDDPRFPDAQPVHPVWVDGFWMDRTEVTNAEFAKFVAATKYVTVAERPLKAEDFPGVPAEQLVPGSIVFTPPDGPVPLNNMMQWWRYENGASWRHPEGPGTDLKGRENYPVVQIAFEDAQAYAKWAGKRLPTEAEWERAARGGVDGKPYTWGDEFTPGGKYMANTFEGHFPNKDTAADGFAGIAPAASFPPNAYGLYDMAGNVWEWCSDWYRPVAFAADAKALAVNPQGPAEAQAFDPQEPGVRKRVQKGGSFLCTDQYCTRYMPGGRGKGEPSSGANHIGFRCVITPARGR